MLIDWLIDRLIDWLIVDRLIDWLIDWLMFDRLIDWLIDWSIDLFKPLNVWSKISKVCSCQKWPLRAFMMTSTKSARSVQLHSGWITVCTPTCSHLSACCTFAWSHYCSCLIENVEKLLGFNKCSFWTGEEVGSFIVWKLHFDFTF